MGVPAGNAARLSRLIPGMQAAQARAPSWQKIAMPIVPAFFRAFHPTMLPGALLDIVTISALLGLAALRSPAPLPASVAGLFAAAFLIFAATEGLYGQRTGSEAGLIGKAVAWSAALASLVPAPPPHGRALLFLCSGMICCLLCGRRWVTKSIAEFHGGSTPRHVMVVGSGWTAQRVARAIERDPHSGRIVKACLTERHFRDIYGPAALQRVARQECIDEIVVATSDTEVSEAVVRQARECRLDVLIAPDCPPASGIENLDGVSLLQVHRQPQPEWGLTVKRMADATGAALGLLATSPLLLLLAAVIRLDSPGPALYRSHRIGRKGQRFTCYKFRTMFRGAEDGREFLRVHNERSGAFFKLANDPRVTRAGGFLRRYSLDELPQLWNVLRGDMSLVGPRPHPPDDVERYDIEHLQRLDFVPGMTGLWQVTARRDPSFELSVALDVEYIKTWSLALDLRILCKTIVAVLNGSGV